MTSILAIDDEDVILKLLKVTLEGEGYKFLSAQNAKKGLEAIADLKPDVVLLDLGLPDLPGSEVLKRLRSWSKIPVIVLTVRESDQDKVELLDLGADDYVTKPFSASELLARIRAALRHRRQEIQSEPVFVRGALKVSFEDRRVTLDDQVVKLTSTEYELLRVLIQNAGKVVTQRQLLKEVWGGNNVEHTQYLRVYIGHLRQKLEKEGSEKLIVTESGVGYRLIIN